MPHIVYIPFLFALGACVGSFLNVVVWRLPRDESLVHPPSHCPRCNHRLAWNDNIPVLGWIFLGGKCRYCRAPISPRYPIIEAITGVLFVFYYVMLFIEKLGPSVAVPPPGVWWGFGGMQSLDQDWPVYGLYVYVISSLLAASLIDAELFIIPLEIPWLMAGVGIITHAIIDRPDMPGGLTLEPLSASLSAGAAIGLLISILLWWLGKIPVSFPDGEPILEVDRAAIEAEIAAETAEAKKEGREVPPLPPEYTPKTIRAEMGKEILFLMPPLALGILFVVLEICVPGVASFWRSASQTDWASGLLGALLGAGVATVAFFLAPFFGILLAIYLLLTGKRRELPYGPYLSMATAFVMLFYVPIAAYLSPGLTGLALLIRGLFGGGGQA